MLRHRSVLGGRVVVLSLLLIPIRKWDRPALHSSVALVRGEGAHTRASLGGGAAAKDHHTAEDENRENHYAIHRKERDEDGLRYGDPVAGGASGACVIREKVVGGRGGGGSGREVR